MKIICTEAEKEWLIHLMANSDRCPLEPKCEQPCTECYEKNVEWTIDEGAALPPMGQTPTCGECAYFLGAGDWDLCCKLPHPEYPYGHLCYEWTNACESFKRWYNNAGTAV